MAAILLFMGRGPFWSELDNHVVAHGTNLAPSSLLAGPDPDSHGGGFRSYAVDAVDEDPTRDGQEGS